MEVGKISLEAVEIPQGDGVVADFIRLRHANGPVVHLEHHFTPGEFSSLYSDLTSKVSANANARAAKKAAEEEAKKAAEPTPPTQPEG